MVFVSEEQWLGVSISTVVPEVVVRQTRTYQLLQTALADQVITIQSVVTGRLEIAVRRPDIVAIPLLSVGMVANRETAQWEDPRRTAHAERLTETRYVETGPADLAVRQQGIAVTPRSIVELAVSPVAIIPLQLYHQADRAWYISIPAYGQARTRSYTASLHAYSYYHQ